MNKPVQQASHFLATASMDVDLERVAQMRRPSHIASWAETILQGTLERFETPSSFIERKLMRCCALATLGEKIANLEQRSFAVPTVGAFLQQELLILLLEINLDDWYKILNLTESLVSNDFMDHWRAQVIGAAAAATVAHTLMQRPGALVLLPTPFEDVKLGVDLIWNEEELYFCLSVKSKRTLLGVQAKLIRDRPYLEPDEQKILEGTGQIQRFLSISCFPVLVEVGRHQLNEPLPLLPAAHHWPGAILHDLQHEVCSDEHPFA